MDRPFFTAMTINGTPEKKQSMQRVLLMAIKDLKLLTRDRVGLFFMLAFPILMGVFFGNMMGNIGQSESTSLKVAIVDEDDSPMSQKFVAAVEKIKTVDVSTMDRHEAQDRVRRGRLLAMIAIPEGFGETAGIMWADPPPIELGLDPSRSAESAMLEGMLMQAMGELISARFRDPAGLRAFVDEARQSMDSDETISPAMKTLLSTMMGSFDTMFDALEDVHATQDGNGDDSPFSTGMQIANIKHVDVTREANAGSHAALLSNIRSSWDISFPQSMVWGVLGCVAGFATLTVRENTLGTITRLQVAPVARWQILAGKGVGCFIAVVSVITIMMLVGTALGMRPRSWPLLMIGAVCTAFCFVGIMMLLSLVGRTEQATSGAAWGALVVMAMFGGGMIPVAFMSGFMRTLSEYDPVRWAVISVEGAIWRGFTIQEMLSPCGKLLAVGAVSLSLGSWLISRRNS